MHITTCRRCVHQFNLLAVMYENASCSYHYARIIWMKTTTMKIKYDWPFKFSPSSTKKPIENMNSWIEFLPIRWQSTSKVKKITFNLFPLHHCYFHNIYKQKYVSAALNSRVKKFSSSIKLGGTTFNREFPRMLHFHAKNKQNWT